MAVAAKGILFEYGLSLPPLALIFDFNPQQISRSRSVTIKTGSASITMKKDGTITIKGKDITVEGSGKINIKASKNVVLKGSKILQN